MKKWLNKFAQLLKARDKGTVAITFLLSLPILLTIIGIIVQFALLANARLTLDRALQAAARSAMVCLPTDPAIDSRGGMALVQRSAFMTLQSLSPASPDVSSDGTAVADALRQTGLAVPASYAARYSFAQSATQVNVEFLDANDAPISTMNFAQTAAPRVRITLTYNFQLTVPAINQLIGASANIAGVTGRFQTLSSSVVVQLSDGREAGSTVNGGP